MPHAVLKLNIDVVHAVWSPRPLRRNVCLSSSTAPHLPPLKGHSAPCAAKSSHMSHSCGGVRINPGSGSAPTEKKVGLDQTPTGSSTAPALTAPLTCVCPYETLKRTFHDTANRCHQHGIRFSPLVFWTAMPAGGVAPNVPWSPGSHNVAPPSPPSETPAPFPSCIPGCAAPDPDVAAAEAQFRDSA